MYYSTLASSIVETWDPFLLPSDHAKNPVMGLEAWDPITNVGVSDSSLGCCAVALFLPLFQNLRRGLSIASCQLCLEAVMLCKCTE